MAGTDGEAAVAALGGGADDPRIDAAQFRVVRTNDNSVTLVGVVHDHPASVHRVATAAGALEHDTLALELPDATVALFEGAGERGGEMSAALEASDAEAVGIDGYDLRSYAALARELFTNDLPRSAFAAAFASALRLSRGALAARLFLVGVPVTVDLHSEQRYDCAPGDPPATQAAHEHEHVGRSRALLGALEAPAVAAFDRVRERRMATRLRSLAEDGPVLAVVGYSHLDGVASRL
jgi:hypothetical protein